MVTKYQGSRIDFGFKLTPGADTDIASFNDFDEVIAYLYTGKLKLLKFSNKVKEGYLPLYEIILAGDTVPMFLYGIIDPEVSATLPTGELILEQIMIRGNDKGVKSTRTSLRILPSQIKKEA